VVAVAWRARQAAVADRSVRVHAMAGPAGFRGLSTRYRIPGLTVGVVEAALPQSLVELSPDVTFRLTVLDLPRRLTARGETGRLWCRRPRSCSRHRTEMWLAIDRTALFV